MYGTIARITVKEGKLDELRAYSRAMSDQIAGIVFEHVYKSDSNPNELWVVVAFESREAYHANASSPEQHQHYLGMMELLAAEPEWHDGEIIDSRVPAGDGSLTYA